jgi:hypothetical protein
LTHREKPVTNLCCFKCNSCRYAEALCDKVTIFGFLRTWYNDTRYHYHNPYEPTVGLCTS